MNDETRARLADLEGPTGLDAAKAAGAVARHGLPDFYAELLQRHDGANGFVGENYLDLYGTGSFDGDEWYREFDHFDGLVVFGTNGAGEAYAFDRDGNVHMVPWIGSPEDAIPQGDFDEFVRRLHAGGTFDR